MGVVANCGAFMLKLTGTLPKSLPSLHNDAFPDDLSCRDPAEGFSLGLSEMQPVVSRRITVSKVAAVIFAIINTLVGVWYFAFIKRGP